MNISNYNKKNVNKNINFYNNHYDDWDLETEENLRNWLLLDS